MKKFAMCSLVLAMLGSNVANAETVTKVLDVKPFSKIELSGSSSVTIEKGNEQQVSVTIEHDYLARVNTEVSGGELDLSVREKGWFGGSAKGEFHIVTPNLEALEVSGSGKASVSSVDTKEFVLELSGSGDIKIGELNASRVRISLAGSGDIDIGNLAALSVGVEIMGSGDIDVTGEVAKLRVEIMGSGDFNGQELDTESVRGEIIGSGDITVRSAGSSKFTSIGSGDGRVLQ